MQFFLHVCAQRGVTRSSCPCPCQAPHAVRSEPGAPLDSAPQSNPHKPGPIPDWPACESRADSGSGLARLTVEQAVYWLPARIMPSPKRFRDSSRSLRLVMR